MHAPTPPLARLAAQLARAVQTRGAVPRDGLYSVTLSAPEIGRLAPPDAPGEYCYWSRPASHESLLALGRAAGMTTCGEGRLASVCGQLRRWSGAWVHDADPSGVHGTEVKPLAFVAFSFDPEDRMGGVWSGFPNTMIQVPALLARGSRRTTLLTFSCSGAALDDTAQVLEAWLGHARVLLARESAESATPAFPNRLTPYATEPDGNAWMSLVARTRDAVRGVRMAKAVLARRVSLRGQRAFDVSRAVEALGYRYPGCTHIAWRRDAATLLAASPELLVALRGGVVRSDAIAGTVRRSADMQLDARLADGLVECAKSRHEHALVVNHVVGALAAHCSGIRQPAEPELLRLRFVHHLRTPIRGSVRENHTLLDLLDSIHPTPAVCGTPAPDALAWLRAHEPFARGWYTGAAGWVNPAGEGEFQVLLRCALLEGREAHLFAGAGIVADSDPRAEFEETELKLETMRDALQDA